MAKIDQFNIAYFYLWQKLQEKRNTRSNQQAMMHFRELSELSNLSFLQIKQPTWKNNADKHGVGRKWVKVGAYT